MIHQLLNQWQCRLCWIKPACLGGLTFKTVAHAFAPAALRAALADHEGLRNSVLDLMIANDPDGKFADMLEKFGIDVSKPEDVQKLKEAGAGLPAVIEAAELALNAKTAEDWKAVALKLVDAGSAAQGFIQDGIKALADKLPEPAKSILSDENVSKELALASPDLLKDVINGDIGAALQKLTGAEGKGLRDAIIDAAIKDPEIKAVLDKAQITADDLKAAGDALPDIYNAITSAAQGDIAGAMESLKAIGDKAGPLLEKIGAAVYDSLPADVQQKLTDLGLSKTDLAEGTKALPNLYAAYQALSKDPADYKTAITEIQNAAIAAPGLNSKITAGLYGQLPESVQEKLGQLGITKDNIGEATAGLTNLYAAVEALYSPNPDYKTAISELMAFGEAAPNLSTSVIQKLGESMPEDAGMIKDLLMNPDVASAIATDPELHDALNLIMDGKLLEGASKLLANGNIRTAVIDVVSQDPKVQEMLAKVGLAPEDLKATGEAASHILDAGIALSNGDWQGALQAFKLAAETAGPIVLDKVVDKLVDAMPDSVVKKLESLGITADKIKEAGAGLAHIIDAAEKVASGDIMGALQSMSEAMKAAPSLVTELLNTIGGKIEPTNDTYALLKSILTDKELINALVTDSSLHSALKQLLSNDPAQIIEGVKGLADNETAMTLLGKVIASNEGLMEKLKPFGIESAEDIAKLGPALADAITLGQAITDGDMTGALAALVELAKSLGESGMLDKMLDAVFDKLKINPELKEFIKGSIKSLAEPGVAEQFGAAINSFINGEPVEFIKGLIATVKLLPDEMKTSMLNAMDSLPGSVCKFFSDHDLNKAIVESGSLDDILTGVEKMVSGDLGGAIESFLSAFGSLMKGGKDDKPYEIMGFDMPFSEAGLGYIGKLIENFMAAMPPDVQKFLQDKIGKNVAESGLKSIPFVDPIYGVIDAGKDLIESISNGGDAIDIGLDVAKLLISGADFIPVVSTFTQPLKVVVGIAEATKETADFVSTISDFSESMTGMT